jgi:hypothetical protein
MPLKTAQNEDMAFKPGIHPDFHCRYPAWHPAGQLAMHNHPPLSFPQLLFQVRGKVNNLALPLRFFFFRLNHSQCILHTHGHKPILIHQATGFEFPVPVWIVLV